MVEMAAEDMKNDGTINMAERVAIANTSGHCYTSTVRNYYLREQRIKDMEGGRSMFSQLREENEDETEEEAFENSEVNEETDARYAWVKI